MPAAISIIFVINKKKPKKRGVSAYWGIFPPKEPKAVAWFELIKPDDNKILLRRSAHE